MIINRISRYIVSFIFALSTLLFVSTVSAQTVNVQVMNEAGTGNTATATINLVTTENMSIQGYDMTLEFDSSQIEITNIEYVLGRVSSGLGDETNGLSRVNPKGIIRLQGESTSPDGAAVQSGSAIAKLTYTKKSAGDNPFRVQSNATKFFKINTDGSLVVVQPTTDAADTTNDTNNVTQTGQDTKKPTLFIEWLINFIQSLFGGK